MHLQSRRRWLRAVFCIEKCFELSSLYACVCETINFMIALITVGIIFTGLLTLVATNFFNLLFRGFAPLVASKKTALNVILNTIDPQPGQVVYELGSGSARFLQMVQKKFPDVTLIGVECSLFPFLFSRLVLWCKKSNITIRLQNIFHTNLQDADMIFSYLLPGMMPKLGKKIRSECKPGTRFISYMFSVPHWEPKQIIRQSHDVIYFYEV